MILKNFTLILVTMIILLSFMAMINGFTIVELLIFIIACIVFAANYVKKFRTWIERRLR